MKSLARIAMEAHQGWEYTDAAWFAHQKEIESEWEAAAQAVRAAVLEEAANVCSELWAREGERDICRGMSQCEDAIRKLK